MGIHSGATQDVELLLVQCGIAADHGDRADLERSLQVLLAEWSQVYDELKNAFPALVGDDAVVDDEVVDDEVVDDEVVEDGSSPDPIHVRRVSVADSVDRDGSLEMKVQPFRVGKPSNHGVQFVFIERPNPRDFQPLVCELDARAFVVRSRVTADYVLMHALACSECRVSQAGRSANDLFGGKVEVVRHTMHGLVQMMKVVRGFLDAK